MDNRNPETQPDYNVAPWKFFVALAVVLIAVFLGTMLWMWRDTKPRRRPALLGAPQSAAVSTNAVTNTPGTNLPPIRP